MFLAFTCMWFVYVCKKFRRVGLVRFGAYVYDNNTTTFVWESRLIDGA